MISLASANPFSCPRREHHRIPLFHSLLSVSDGVVWSSPHILCSWLEKHFGIFHTARSHPPLPLGSTLDGGVGRLVVWIFPFPFPFPFFLLTSRFLFPSHVIECSFTYFLQHKKQKVGRKWKVQSMKGFVNCYISKMCNVCYACERYCTRMCLLMFPFVWGSHKNNN